MTRTAAALADVRAAAGITPRCGRPITTEAGPRTCARPSGHTAGCLTLAAIRNGHQAAALAVIRPAPAPRRRRRRSR